jgi:hypothetical protein
MRIVGLMGQRTTLPTRQNYHARLRGGPDDGSDVQLSGRPGGGPPEFFHAGSDDQGMYVLAGSPHSDGTLPYQWNPSLGQAQVDTDPTDATWTLVSVSGDDRSTKVWHQHGEGAEPVRLEAEPLKSATVPSFVGRGYVCRECDDMTVVSRPHD